VSKRHFGKVENSTATNWKAIRLFWLLPYWG